MAEALCSVFKQPAMIAASAPIDRIDIAFIICFLVHKEQSSCRATIAYDQGIGLLACANSTEASPTDASRSFLATTSGKPGRPPCKSGQLKKDLGLEVSSARHAARLVIFEIMRSFFVGSSASVPHGTRTILTRRMMRHAASLRVTRGSS